ncbi:phage tail protein [Weissella paramesenteroides]|uniref:phage tail protein n=1 Tax=Weissella paramesenteroides TaxID=1249 RepID=UPI00123A9E29|nr:phage tail protein [Weissella paramesenteroides]KAA8455236.1 hypothetical protein FKV86_08030 [Weissella paramesenteroides]KAA8456303.1 hypothetical protein FKV78_08495 [Weissella paramesenteroides]KAA8458206.1 hypothetical protein FKV82_07190 [Weissella paramesenteroides]KAA8460197.1 hypothetical protein FKV80_08920 [Weissella paramesenteroides]KAA8461539.1 hypothetical protein FKV85_07900 [Weissella paramesenteroides]
MIKFKNINGDVFLAVGSIKRKSALNGEKSLTGTLFEGDDVLNKIDKGWSLEFDNEPYVVTYFERNDNDNTVEFDAIHKFFWDMTKDVLYFSWSGSHTAKAYLEQIFKDTGYQYALNFEPSAFEKDNWGMKNKLSLFNDVIDSMGGEFEINGTLVSIFKNVGSDLSTIVRHGFNLSDMSLENDNTDFVTYGEGFGAYADQENQTGERLHVTYTSPLAKTFGKLHAEPIDDQRYTIKDNLLQAIKDKVDGSFAVSIKLSLYDLTAAGYPYKMANVGDWLLAIDENLDFKQKIRIISVDDEFATDGTRISYTVTCGDVGVVQKYQQDSASLGQKVENAYQDAQLAKNKAIQAIASADGKNTNYYVNGIGNLPESANEGDIAFVQIGDGQAMYIWTKMSDGSFKWVKRLDPDIGEQIAAGVDDAIKQANSQAAEMDEVQADNLNNFKSEHAEQLASAAAVAQSAANSAADEGRQAAQDAKKYADTAASEALSDANTALATAKQELGSEVSKAQSDITNTQNELAGKVSQTDFNTVTGDLSTKYGQVKLTADKASADLASYKQSNDKSVSANTTAISVTSQEVKTKVSQTDYDANKQAVGNTLSTLSQRADGFDLTVAKVNNLAVGGRNLLLNTIDFSGGTWELRQTEKGDNYGNLTTRKTNKAWDSPISSLMNLVDRGVIEVGKEYTFSTYIKNMSENDIIVAPYGISSIMHGDIGIWQTVKANSDWQRLSATFKFDQLPTIELVTNNAWGIRWEPTTDIVDGNVVFAGYKLEEGNVPTDWTPAPEDVQSGIDSNTAELKILSDEVDTKVAKQEYDANNQLINGKFAEQKLTADGLQTVVTDISNSLNSEYVDPGPNLLEGASDWSGDSWSEHSEINEYYKGNRIYSNHFGNSPGYTVLTLYSNDNFKPENKYEYSVWVKNVGNADTKLTLSFSGSSWATYDKTAMDLPANSNWVKFTKTMQSFGSIQPDSYNTIRVKSSEISEIYYAGPSFTKYTGNDLIPKAIQSVRTQTADMIAQEVVDRETGDSNILVQAKDFTSSQITDVTNGYTSAIQQSATVIREEISNKIDRTTALSLFKDSWSLGIEDNTDALINGINGDGTNVRIAAKKLIIDQDVAIGGTGWMDGAVIKNASIGTAQIGTIDANQANIINLDASKISVGRLTGIIIGGDNAYWDLSKGYFNISSQSAGGPQKDYLKIDGSGMELTQYDNNYNKLGHTLYGYRGQQFFAPDVNYSLTEFYSYKSGNSGVMNLMVTSPSGSGTTTPAQLTLNGDAKEISISVNGSNGKPTALWLGSDGSGNRLWSQAIYDRTYSGGANVQVTGYGTLGRITSASKYKLAITHYDELDRANKLLSIKPARWFDKAETEQYADELNGNDNYDEHLPVKPHFGLIAEDLVDAGLEEFVSYGLDGEVEGLEYDRVWTVLIPLIKNMQQRIKQLEGEN